MAEPPTFDVMDFGAKGDGVTLDTAAIQSALDAAYAAGGGVVYLPEGVYIVHSITGDASDGALQIRDNVTLAGAGMGLSTIKVRDGEISKITGIVRTPSGEVTHDVVIQDLTIDGNHQNNSGEIDGFFCGVTPGSNDYDYNILIQRVEIQNVSRYGFDPHEQTKNLTIRDSIAHDNIGDGFTIDFCFDTILENNVSYNNGRYGFNIVTSSHDVLLLNNIAYSNMSNGISIQKGSEDRPFIYDIMIEGGSVYDNGKYGIEIKLSEQVTVTGVQIYGNKSGGISIFGAQDNLIVGNHIYNNGSYGVKIREYDDRAGVQGTNRIWASSGNTVTGNTFSGQSTAVLQEADSSTGNAAHGNFGGGLIKGIGLVPLSEPSGSTNHSYDGYVSGGAGTIMPSPSGEISSPPAQTDPDPPLANPSDPAGPPDTPTGPPPSDQTDADPLSPPGLIEATEPTTLEDSPSDPADPDPVTPPPPAELAEQPDGSTTPQVSWLERLNAAFENLLWRGPTAANEAFLDSLATAIGDNTLTPADAFGEIVQLADATTAVATLAYAFFTGATPSQGGYAYLVDPDGPNPNNLNSAYYQAFNLENRFINFAVNLGAGGEGRSKFLAEYGALSLRDATRAAYKEIFGTAPAEGKLDQILSAELTSGERSFNRVEYLASYGGDGVEGLGTKAAMVGFLLAEAAKADAGTYALASNAYLVDLADGASFRVDIVGVYGQPEFALGG